MQEKEAAGIASVPEQHQEILGEMGSCPKVEHPELHYQGAGRNLGGTSVSSAR